MPKLQWMLRFQGGTIYSNYTVYPEGSSPKTDEFQNADYVVKDGVIVKSKWSYRIGKRAGVSMAVASLCDRLGFDYSEWGVGARQPKFRTQRAAPEYVTTVHRKDYEVCVCFGGISRSCRKHN